MRSLLGIAVEVVLCLAVIAAGYLLAFIF